jgi:hypothetical protein
MGVTRAAASARHGVSGEADPPPGDLRVAMTLLLISEIEATLRRARSHSRVVG